MASRAKNLPTHSWTSGARAFASERSACLTATLRNGSTWRDVAGSDWAVADDVDVHHLVVSALVRLGDGLWPVRGRVVDNDVDASPLLDHLVQREVHLPRVGDVAPDADDAVVVFTNFAAPLPRLADGPREGRVGRPGRCEQRDVRAPLRQANGDGLADAPAGARHDHHLVVEGEGASAEELVPLLAELDGRPFPDGPSGDAAALQRREQGRLGASEALEDVELDGRRRVLIVALGVAVELQLADELGGDLDAVHALGVRPSVCPPRKERAR